MDTQKGCIFPVPIVYEIMDICDIREETALGCTCKLLCSHFHKNHPTLTTTLHLPVQIMGRFAVLDSSSNILYVSDQIYNVVYKIDLSSHKIEAIYNTSNNRIVYNQPTGLALNEKEKILYVADAINVISGINLIDGSITTLYGSGFRGSEDGIGTQAAFHNPQGLAFDSVSNHLYVADSFNRSIRRIILNERKVETFCKKGYIDGSLEEDHSFDLFYRPQSIVLNSKKEELYVSEPDIHVIRAISLKDKTVWTLCGTERISGYRGETGNVYDRSTINYPSGLAIDSDYLYFTDSHNQVVRKISLSGRMMENISQVRM